jgi:hypothetical protein
MLHTFLSPSVEDTPSKNTRSQICTTPVKITSPKERMSLTFLTDTPSKNTRLQLQSPPRNLSLEHSQNLQSPRKSILKSSSEKLSVNVATPSKGTRLQQRLLLSPSSHPPAVTPQKQSSPFKKKPHSSASGSPESDDDDVIRRRPSKRRDLPDASEALTQFGSEVKKRKTNEYFSTSEIFIEQPLFLADDTNANISFPNKENEAETPNRNFTGSKFGSLETEQHTSSRSNFSENDLDPPDSPIFGSVEVAQDEDPPSPVFTSPTISNARPKIGVSPQVDKLTPGKTKKYSPLMSKNSLMQLMCSPMTDKPIASDSKGSSRRELYKSK